MRYLLIDRITEWEPGKRAAAVKAVSLSEDFFEEHFPSRPVLPGALIIEGMAQVAGVLVEESATARFGEHGRAMLSIIEKAKFRGAVVPGDRLDYEAELLSLNEAGGRVKCRARVDGRIVANATLVLALIQGGSNPVLEAKRRTAIDHWMKGLPADA